MPDATCMERCLVCETPLHPMRHVLARQTHCIEYTRRGDTPNDQAVLSPSSPVIKASFCSKACRNLALPRLLIAEGLPPGFAHNRLEAGPLCPCGKCGAPVNMTQAHAAWVKGEFEITQVDDEWHTSYQWFDVLAVLCASCAGEGVDAQSARAEPAAESEKPAEIVAKPRVRRRVKAAW